MRWIRALLLILLFGLPAFAQVTINEQPAPAVNAGTTFAFHCTAVEGGGCTWTCPSCAGSINASTGVYTAPAAGTVHAANSYGGYQLLPNDHIYNQRIDSLSVNANSTTWINATGGSGGIPFSIREFSFPVNWVNGSTPLQSMFFNYTTAANGTNFQIPAYPGNKIESGWFTRPDGNRDHHLLTIDTTGTLGTFQEMYQYYASCATTAASVTANVATLTLNCNPQVSLFYVGEQVGIDSFTGADTYFNLSGMSAPTLTAVTSTTISFALTHANASATSNGKLGMNVDCPSCVSASGIRYSNATYALPDSAGGAGGVDAASCYIMPLEYRLQEVEQALANSTTLKHAVRVTLQTGFLASSFIWPATANATDGGTVPFGARFRLKSSFNITGFSTIAQLFLKQLQQYGIIATDGGTGWATQPETTSWPVSIRNAMAEISTANITPNNFEAVDESGLMVTALSGVTTTSEKVIATGITNPTHTASQQVILTGVTVGLPDDVIYVQANTGARQLSASVHGGAANTVTWAMSPTVGTLTSAGLFTPPSSIVSVTSTTITATSTDDGTVAASMTAFVVPTGGIYERPVATSPFTDTNSHVWAPSGGDSGAIGCCGDLSGGPWGGAANIAEYYYKDSGDNNGDIRFDFTVPNGVYQVTVKCGTDQSSAGGQLDTLEAQGVVYFTKRDIFTDAGGSYKPIDYVMSNVVVSNGKLSVVLRAALDPGNSSGPQINGLQILQTAGTGDIGSARTKRAKLEELSKGSSTDVQ